MAANLSPEGHRAALYVQQAAADGKAAGEGIRGLAEQTGLGDAAMTDPTFMAILQEAIDSDLWPWPTFRPKLSLPKSDAYVGATGDSSVKCHFCGGSSVLSRAAGAGPGGTGICRDCAVDLAKNFTDSVARSTGIVDGPHGSTESSADEATLWEGFDAAFSRMSLLHGIEDQIESAQESIDLRWYGDSGDKPPTRINEDLALVTTLLYRHGYHEVSIVVGVDTELAAKGELRGFYVRPDPDSARWTAQIKFDRGGSPTPSTQ